MKDPSGLILESTFYNVRMNSIRVRVSLILCCLFLGTAGAYAQVTPVITANGPVSFCNKDSVVLTVSPQSPTYTYQWLRGGPIVGATGTSYTVKIGSTYKVVIISASGRRDTSAPLTVSVKPVSSAVTPAAPTSLCGGATSLTLYGPTGNYSYQWLLANNPIAGATTGSYTVTTPGNYRVFVTNRSNNCTDTSDPRNIQSAPNPVASITPSANATRCASDSLVLQATTPGSLQWQWFYNNSPITGATGARYVARTYAGDYSLQVVDSNGCQSDTSTPVTLTINPTPTANITFSGAVSFCEGSSIILNTQTEPGNLLQWIINGVLHPQDNATFKSVSSSGTYRIQTTNAFGCTALSPIVPVTVHPAPQPTVTRNGLVLRVANPQAFVYQWYQNTLAIPGEVYRSYTVTSIGSYSVKITDGYGCEGTSTPEFFSNLAVENFSPEALRVYPNPTSNLLYIESPVAVQAALYDLTGRPLLNTAEARQIDLSGFAEGLYFLHLTDKNGRLLKVEKVFRR